MLMMGYHCRPQSQIDKTCVILAILLITVGSNHQLLITRVWASWSASTIIEVAEDLLKPSDDPSFSQADPLLIDAHDHHHSSKIIKGTSPPIPKQVVEKREKDEEHKGFIVPMLSYTVGDNNQLMEYMTAAVIARATKRTLCLTPFFRGPSKHTGQLPSEGLKVKDRYDLNALRKFVNVSSLERCLEKCNKNIDAFWWLRHSSSSSLGKYWTWNDKNMVSIDLGWSFVNWTSVDDIKQAVEKREEENCVALGGLFPGLRWRGAYLAPSLFFRSSQSILTAASALQAIAIGHTHSFLAVHWRFEESICQMEQLGLCFLRCGDGAVIDSGLRAATRGLPALSKLSNTRSSCKHIVDSEAILVSRQDLIAAIKDKASKENVTSIYLATDGWLRGPHSKALVKEVVEDLRMQGFIVVGLWKIDGLPNLSRNGYNMSRDRILNEALSKRVSGHFISEIEQEICFRAKSFMGSGESTWSLAVFRARLVSRKWQGIMQSNLIDNNNTVVEKLLEDLHPAGLQCRYHALYNKAKISKKLPQENYEDEYPDTWLDLEACEARIGQGGTCKALDCSS